MIRLPIPPSTNNLFVTRGRKRVISPAYRAWRTEAGLRLNVQRPQSHAKSRRLAVAIHVPDTVRGDLDNRIKGLLDLIVDHGLIADDRFIDSIQITRGPCLIDDEITLDIWPMDIAKRLKARAA